MRRSVSLLVLGVGFAVLFAPTTAYADNCSTLLDCYNTARAGLAALVGLSVMFGVLLSMGLDFVPGVGTIKGIIEAITGRDIITGQELAWWERVLGIVPLAAGIADATVAGAKMAGAAKDLDRAADAVKAAEHATEAAKDLDHVAEATEAGKDAKHAAADGARAGGAGLDELDEAFRRLESGEAPSGALLGDLMHHRERREAMRQLRDLLQANLPSRPGRTPDGVALNPSPGYQSAHSTPQAAFRGFPQYDPGEMITRFLPTGRGHAHTLFDQHWQQQYREIHKLTGRTTTTARELQKVTERAARESGAFSPAEAESVAGLIFDDLYRTLELSPDQVLRMPGID